MAGSGATQLDIPKWPLVPAYDVQIAKTLEAVQPDQPLPDLWKEFDALARIL